MLDFGVAYLFHSNYPYFQALHLGRFVRWLARIELQIQADLTPTQQHCHVAYSAGKVVFKDGLFDPGISSEEFARRQAEEARFSALDEKERDRELEGIAERLRSGEIESDDAGEDASWLAPVKDRERVVEFVQLSHAVLKPFAEFVVPGDSLLEDLVVRHVSGPRAREDLRGLDGGLAAWDLMRMHEEGRPPYSISFAPGFSKSLRQVITDEEGEEPPAAKMEAMMRGLSRPREYRMKKRDFARAAAGVSRANSAGVIPEPIARELHELLESWAK